jgi:D-3-phosphoglycerate dehydrogenase / 2-oxoglutarate reductase
VWDFEAEIEPSEHMIFVIYEDRPGIIGRVGTILGEHRINIATMEVGRKSVGGEALMALTVDSPVPPEVLASIADAIDAERTRAVTMPP